MVILSVYYIPTSLYTSLATAIPSPLNVSLETRSLENSHLVSQNTTLGQVVPTDFIVAAGTSSGPSLPKNSCLLQTLVAIGQLATRGFNGRQPSISSVNPLFAIEVDGGRQGAALDRKYAIWGLYGVISYMLSKDDFHTRLFTLRWQGLVVGRIRLNERIPPDPSGDNDTMYNVETSAQGVNIVSLSNGTAISTEASLCNRFIDGGLEYDINLFEGVVAKHDRRYRFRPSSANS